MSEQPLRVVKAQANGVNLKPLRADKRVRYVRRIDQIPQIPPEVAARLGPVAKRYVFRANNYYLGLIDWSDENDPIRQLIIPREEELTDWGRFDASNEAAITPVRGVQHKY
ncbi:MAG: hypothetical protein OXC14_17565, partial [Rhodospirillaceae bacterium]|nr:hypothetical protein [Rhodospirillaceae bacterium]